MEQLLNNIAGARQVFERWMEWEPHEQAWLTYIKFELKYKETDRARQIYERYILLMCMILVIKLFMLQIYFIHCIYYLFKLSKGILLYATEIICSFSKISSLTK